MKKTAGATLRMLNGLCHPASRVCVQLRCSTLRLSVSVVKYAKMSCQSSPSLSTDVVQCECTAVLDRIHIYVYYNCHTVQTLYSPSHEPELVGKVLLLLGIRILHTRRLDRINRPPYALVDGEHDRLSGGYAQDARRYALVEGPYACVLWSWRRW